MVFRRESKTFTFKMKNRDKDITCLCAAYNHPHRLGGGSCNGTAWCESFRSIDSYDCENCNCNDSGICQIITGQESINSRQCECIISELRSRYIEDNYGYLPLDLERHLLAEERSFREI